MQTTWNIDIQELATHLSVGVHPHERGPQQILADVWVEANYALHPKDLKDCVDYEKIYELVTQEWPKREHVNLLETYVAELLIYLFQDARVSRARVGLYKSGIYEDARRVGVSAEWTREDFQKMGK